VRDSQHVYSLVRLVSRYGPRPRLGLFCLGRLGTEVFEKIVRQRHGDPLMAIFHARRARIRTDMMYRTWFSLIALALVAGSPAIADPLGSGTKKEREACAPDTVKLCKHELDVNASDTAAILKCLQRNREKLSTRCQAVLQDHGQ
jgi:hypothetical protein